MALQRVAAQRGLAHQHPVAPGIAPAVGTHDELVGAALGEIVRAGEQDAPVRVRHAGEGHAEVVLVVAAEVEPAEAAGVGERGAVIVYGEVDGVRRGERRGQGDGQQLARVREGERPAGGRHRVHGEAGQVQGELVQPIGARHGLDVAARGDGVRGGEVQVDALVQQVHGVQRASAAALGLAVRPFVVQAIVLRRQRGAQPDEQEHQMARPADRPVMEHAPNVTGRPGTVRRARRWDP